MYPVPNDQFARESSGIWLPVLQDPAARSVLPVNKEYARSKVGRGALTAGLALKRAAPPIAALVQLEDSLPSAVSCHGRWYRIAAVTTPERFSGLWWDKPIRKSYYVAMIEETIEGTNQAMILLVQDHEINNWFIEGFFD